MQMKMLKEKNDYSMDQHKTDEQNQLLETLVNPIDEGHNNDFISKEPGNFFSPEASVTGNVIKYSTLLNFAEHKLVV